MKNNFLRCEVLQEDDCADFNSLEELQLYHLWV